MRPWLLGAIDDAAVRAVGMETKRSGHRGLTDSRKRREEQSREEQRRGEKSRGGARLKRASNLFNGNQLDARP